MRILWIDDEMELLKPFVYSLKKKGYDVETATNGPDGLALARTKDFDLVLLDEWMSGMDGLSVLKGLKEIAPNILVAMVTKSEEEGLMNEAYAKLADDFVIKPLSMPQLLSVFKRLLEKKRIVAGRLAQEYSGSFGFDLPQTWLSWTDYYQKLVRWGLLLTRFSDAGLKEVHEDRFQSANAGFVRYIEEVYPNWMKGRTAPVLSHQVFKEFIQPELGSRPVYFLLFDSMRLDQWFSIVPILQDQFRVDTKYYSSILPTATPYARNAIYAGLLPGEINRQYPQYWVSEPKGQNRYEKELLEAQLGRAGSKAKAIFIKVTRAQELESARELLLKGNADLYVLVINFLDFLIHSIKSVSLLDELVRDESTILGLTRLWFASSQVYDIMKVLANRDCRIVITSDHGFIKVRRPTLVYGGREISANLRYKHGAALRCDPKTAVVLNNPQEYMLPVDNVATRFIIAKEDFYFIYPTKPKEYESTYKHTLQHGGISLEEMILPIGFLRSKTQSP
jgi:CheY-like chemotaxis protein